MRPQMNMEGMVPARDRDILSLYQERRESKWAQSGLVVGG